MRNITPAVAVMGALALGGGAAHASVISVSAGLSSLGDPATIIPAPANVADQPPGAENTAMQAFDERQRVLLGSAVTTDTGSIAAGTLVDSHMIFLNTAGDALTTHFDVTWTFDGAILGVMSDIGGTLIEASNPQLSSPATSYPGAFGNQGFESGSFPDSYSVSGNTITVTMQVTEPGDWMRVVTAPVPLPAALPLLGGALALLGAVHLRRRNKS